MHRFRLINTLKQPIHISSLRLSAGFLQAAVRIRMDDSEGEEFATTNAWIAPHQSADIWVQVDTGRFAGTKTSAVYVQFDQPAAAEVRLQVAGHSKEGTEPDNAPPGPRDPKMKIGELETPNPSVNEGKRRLARRAQKTAGQTPLRLLAASRPSPASNPNRPPKSAFFSGNSTPSAK